MLQLHNIQDAIRQAKRRKNKDEGAPKGVNGISRQRLSRIVKDESKASLSELESIATAYSFNICLLSDAECEILRQLSLFCGKNGVKEGGKGE